MARVRPALSMAPVGSFLPRPGTGSAFAGGTRPGRDNHGPPPGTRRGAGRADTPAAPPTAPAWVQRPGACRRRNLGGSHFRAWPLLHAREPVLVVALSG